MTRDEKLDVIAALASGYGRVDELLEGIGPDELRFVPPPRDAWSINDFLVHFLDADLSLAFRVRASIAEPGKAIPAWEEDAWRDALHYGEEDGLACLGLAKSLRAFTCTCLRSAVDDDWSLYCIDHPARGRMGLVDLIEMYEQHIAFHLPLIKRNREAWRKRGA
jgi:hypothetical protein